MILISLGTEVFNPTFKESILAEKHQDNNVFPNSCLTCSIPHPFPGCGADVVAPLAASPALGPA